jgi:exocyst complex component 4
MAAGRQRDEAPVRRPGKSDARQRKRSEPREEVWDVGTEGGGKFAEIDSILRKIRKDWPFVLESDFSPSTLALSLLSQSPSSSLPQHPALSSFMSLHGALSTALQTAVQSHFQTFAASLPAHASFVATLGRAQQQVKKSKGDLREARDGFAGKGKSELAGVRARERVVRDMLKILDTM